MRTMVWLAALLAGLAQASPAVISTVDAPGTVGWYSSIQLDAAGRPVLSYQDETNQRLKFARCTASCGTAAATWATSVVDHDGDVGFYTSLAMNGGRPVIAYYDVKRGALKLATCVAQCDGASPQWSVAIVDSSSPDTGRFPTLRFVAGKPIIAYRDKSNRRVMFAACKAGCETASATWTMSVVDGANDPGRFAHMALDGDRPVIVYLDFWTGDIKVATCVAACFEAQAAWAVKIVDTVNNFDTEMQFSIDVGGGKTWISYFAYESPSAGTLRAATCIAACDSPDATWIVEKVDAVGIAGLHSSIRVRDDGRPVVAYAGEILARTDDPGTGRGFLQIAYDLRLAVCMDACATPAAQWAVTTADNQGLAGWYPALLLAGDSAIVAYHDSMGDDLKVAWVDLASASLPVNHTGLWWDFAESGWGVNFAHQGEILFATLFTYDASGAPMWLVMSSGTRQAGDVFSGALYRSTGPAFDADPFVPITPANLTPVGNMTVSFAGDTAELAYSVNGRFLGKRIKQQVFGASPAECHPTGDDRAGLANYQDLWWNSRESGWGLNLAQQGSLLFGTLFTYARDGSGLWLVMPAGARKSDGTFEGDLYRTAGHPFDQLPFQPLTPSDARKVGVMRLEFSSGVRGTLRYSVDGTSVVKSIERQVFAAPAPACRG